MDKYNDIKPQYKPVFPTQRQQQQRVEKYHYPNIPIDQALLLNFFNTVQEGNLTLIREFITNNNFLCNALNPNTGESAIHNIIKNEALTDDEKYEIIKFLINRGAGIMTYDLSNITPLHLSVKYNDYNISKLLIKNGANVNAQDNQGLTPLHYALQGNITECNTQRTNMIKNLIDIPMNINENINNNTYDINTEIITYIENDSNLKEMFFHIKNTIVSTSDIYKKYFTETIEEPTKKYIHEMLLSSKPYNSNEIFNNIENNYYQKINNELKKSLEKIIFNPEIIDGWGPSETIKILPIKNINDKIKEMQTIYDNKLKNGDIYIAIKNIFKKLNQSKNIIEVNMNNYQQNINNIYNYIDQNIFSLLTKPILTEIKKYITSRKTVLLLDIDKQSKLINLKDSLLNIKINNNIKNFYPNYESNILSIINYYLYNILIYINLIIVNMSAILKQVTDDYVFNTYNDIIPIIMTSIYNYILYENNLLLEINNAKNIFINSSQKYNEMYNNYKYEYVKLIQENCDNIITSLDTISQEMSNIYKIVTTVITTINDIINIINNKSAIQYMLIYHKKYNIPITTDLKTFYINKIFNRNLEKIKTLETFINLKSEYFPNEITMDNINKIKKIIYEKYMPVVDIYTHNNYYTNDIINKIDKKYKYISLNYLDKEVTKFINIKEQSLQYGFLVPFTTGITVTEKSSNLNFLVDKPILKNIDNTVENINLIGKFGVIKKEYKLHYKNNPIPIIKNLIDDHFYFIKYQIIEYIIYEIYNKNIKPLKDLIDKYKKTIDEIKIIKNKEAYVYSIIGSFIDNIIISFIKSCIHSASIKYANKLLNNTVNDSKIKSFAQNLIVEKHKNKQIEFKMNIDEIIESILDQYNKISPPIVQPTALSFTSILGEDQKQNNHKAYHFSLTSGKNSTICYNNNENIIELLLNNKADVNIKDNIGQSPIFYAIDIQQIDIIKLLIKKYHASVNIIKSRNAFNITPLQYTINQYKSHLNLFIPLSPNTTNIITSFTNPIYKKINEIIENDTIFKGNILKYSDIIFPQFLIIINNYLFKKLKEYPNEYTFEDLQEFIKKTNSTINPENPLLKSPAIDNIFVYNTNILEKQIDINNKEIEKKNNENKLLGSSNDNLNKEKMIIEKKTTERTVVEKTRLDKINLIIGNNNKEIENNESLIDKINKKNINFRNMDNNINKEKKEKINELLKNNNYDDNNIVLTYDNIFKLINDNNINKADTDFRTYNELWYNYIKDDKKINNIINLHIFMMNYENTIITNFQEKTKDELREELNSIKKIYENVIKPLCIDYNELPLEYNDTNYILKITIDVMKHVLKHTLLASFYLVIVKTITKYLKDVYSTNLSDDVEKIINNTKIMFHIFEEMPLILIKQTCNIYNGETDSDRNISIDSLYNKIPDIIVQNQIIPITQDSTLIKSIKEILIPYFKKYIELFIKELYNMSNGYYTYMLAEYNLINMVITLTE